MTEICPVVAFNQMNHEISPSLAPGLRLPVEAACSVRNFPPQ